MDATPVLLRWGSVGFKWMTSNPSLQLRTLNEVITFGEAVVVRNMCAHNMKNHSRDSLFTLHYLLPYIVIEGPVCVFWVPDSRQLPDSQLLRRDNLTFGNLRTRFHPKLLLYDRQGSSCNSLRPLKSFTSNKPRSAQSTGG